MPVVNGAHIDNCDRCHVPFSVFSTVDSSGSGAPGYGVYTNDEGDREYLCYACAADITRQEMRETGRITLYLSSDASEVTDWPGVLRFKTFNVRRSRTASFGGWTERLDLNFRDDDGQVWYGRHQGHNNDLVRCRRVGQ